MNADQVATLRALLAPTGWLDRTSAFAAALRHSARTPNGLLIFGTAQDEPWHMTAHLDDESRLAGLPELRPTLVRWAPPPDAPPHLAVGLDRLRAASRGQTLLVVSGELAPADLLERVSDVRKLGATVFALDRGDRELEGIAHEALPVPQAEAPMTFDAAQHLVSAATAAPGLSAAGPARPGPRFPASAPAPGLRGRLARALDAISGTQPD
jgi:hypothetical protein